MEKISGHNFHEHHCGSQHDHAARAFFGGGSVAGEIMIVLPGGNIGRVHKRSMLTESVGWRAAEINWDCGRVRTGKDARATIRR